MKTFSQTPTQLFTETQQTGITAGFPDLVHSSFKDGDWYTAFYNNIPVMLHSIDNSGYIIDVSEYWLLKLGYKREEVIGRKSIDFLTEESREYAISKVFPVFLKTGRVEDIQYQFVKKNGDIMDGLISSTSEKDDNGVVIRSFAVIIDITDRLRAEREKKTFLELSLDIVGSCGLDGYFREINPAVEKILGYTQEEFCSKSFMDFVHPDDVEKTLREAEKSFSGSPTVSFTNRYRCKDGTYKWLEWNTIPVGDYLHTIARDATKWKEAQEALQISENQFKGAFEYSAIGMALVSPEGRWKEVNEQVCEIIGYDKSELMKLTFQDITHPDDIDLDLRYLQELIEDKRPSYTMEKRYFHKNGTIVWVLLAVSKVTDKNNTILHYIAQIQNITERKKAEQQLREQAALLEVVPDAISIRDLDDRFTFWNKGAEKMYGYTFDEIAGKTPVELRGKESSEEFQKAKEILMQTGAWSGEVWLKRKNGTSILIQSRWTLIKDSNGNPTSILSTNTDITEKRSIEKQLLRSQRLESIGTLASGVAHDLNNLLTPVVLGMELIKLQINDDQGRQRINSLVSIVQRGSSLIQQLLSFAKGKDGPREAMNVRYIIDESVKFVRETFPRNIDVQVDIAKDELIISGDSTQINQVIMNLLINARDAMEVHGGLLTIKASRIVADELLLKRYVDASPGQYIAITVRDTGIGIPPELQDRVFEPFFTTKEQGKGTGIGLTTVFSIVRNYKGFITLYSEIGKGTAFTVYLPYIEQAESDTNYVVSLQKKSVKNECVLFVDDEEFIRSIAADTLVSFGYKVLTAANGEEAMNVFLQNQSEIALVITDVMMPVKGGLELLQDLRKLDPAIKVIAASGLMHSKIASDLQARGVAAVLQKPYTVHELLETVQNTLALKEA